MSRENDTALIILVVEDIAETRDGIEKLLKADGYRVSVAGDEQGAIESAQRKRPDLILVSLAGLLNDIIATARRIRERAAVGDDVPVVIFCIEEIGEGDEVAVGQNVHITRPDNFNQLRALLTRLLSNIPKAVRVDTMQTATERQFMTANSNTVKPFMFRFLDAPSKVLLELTNATDNKLKSIEILTVFLKEESPAGGPSQAHIRFDAVESMKPRERAVLSHRTWINGRPADPEYDQLERLKVIPGEVSPYVLDISWEDAEGKARFQRIPVGH